MHIFMSYSSKDRSVADSLALALGAEGHEVFFDRQRIKAGTGYHRLLREALSAADALVFLVSPDSVRSRCYAVSELKFARERWPHPAGRVLPVLLRPTPLEALPTYLRAVSLLEPEGDLCAEVLHALATWSASAAPASDVANVSVPQRRLVLLRAAIGQAISGSYGAGPSTDCHRRLDQAERWVRQAQGLARSDGDADLQSAAAKLATFVEQARRSIPAPGLSREPYAGDDDSLRTLRHQMSNLEGWLATQIASLPQLPDHWAVLGFRDERDFDDSICLTMDRVLAASDAMIRELAHRLATHPIFTPRELVAEGFRRAVVLDMLNALLRAEWARWTGEAPDGDDWPGVVTPVGQRLLAQRLG
jgi:hypothetical protein